jgi:hypothetical protein
MIVCATRSEVDAVVPKLCQVWKSGSSTKGDVGFKVESVKTSLIR